MNRIYSQLQNCPNKSLEMLLASMPNNHSHEFCPYNNQQPPYEDDAQPGILCGDSRVHIISKNTARRHHTGLTTLLMANSESHNNHF